MTDPSVAVPADWYADPTGRHEYRYWDGRAWTDHVADSGVPSVDPLVDAKARLEALRTLERDHGRGATARLIAALDDPDHDVRKLAIRALEGRPGPESIAPLMKVLDSGDQNLASYAMRTLVENPAAETVLAETLGRQDAEPTDAAITALTDAIRFGGLKNAPRCSAVLRAAFRRSWKSARSLALIGLLIECGDPAGQVLAAAVNAGDETAMWQAVGIL